MTRSTPVAPPSRPPVASTLFSGALAPPANPSVDVPRATDLLAVLPAGEAVPLLFSERRLRRRSPLLCQEIIARRRPSGPLEVAQLQISGGAMAYLQFYNQRRDVGRSPPVIPYDLLAEVVHLAVAFEVRGLKGDALAALAEQVQRGAASLDECSEFLRRKTMGSWLEASRFAGRLARRLAPPTGCPLEEVFEAIGLRLQHIDRPQQWQTTRQIVAAWQRLDSHTPSFLGVTATRTCGVDWGSLTLHEQRQGVRLLCRALAMRQGPQASIRTAISTLIVRFTVAGQLDTWFDSLLSPAQLDADRRPLRLLDVAALLEVMPPRQLCAYWPRFFGALALPDEACLLEATLAEVGDRLDASCARRTAFDLLTHLPEAPLHQLGPLVAALDGVVGRLGADDVAILTTELHGMLAAPRPQCQAAAARALGVVAGRCEAPTASATLRWLRPLLIAEEGHLALCAMAAVGKLARRLPAGQGMEIWQDLVALPTPQPLFCHEVRYEVLRDLAQHLPLACLPGLARWSMHRAASGDCMTRHGLPLGLAALACRLGLTLHGELTASLIAASWGDVRRGGIAGLLALSHLADQLSIAEKQQVNFLLTDVAHRHAGANSPLHAAASLLEVAMSADLGETFWHKIQSLSEAGPLDVQWRARQMQVQALRQLSADRREATAEALLGTLQKTSSEARLRHAASSLEPLAGELSGATLQRAWQVSLAHLASAELPPTPHACRLLSTLARRLGLPQQRQAALRLINYLTGDAAADVACGAVLEVDRFLSEMSRDALKNLFFALNKQIDAQLKGPSGDT